MKILTCTVCLLMVFMFHVSVSHSFIPDEQMLSITSKCVDDVSGMEKAFGMEAQKIPMPVICETLKKDDRISIEKCVSFFEQKKEAELVVDFKSYKEAYTVLFETCIEIEVDNLKQN